MTELVLQPAADEALPERPIMSSDRSTPSAAKAEQSAALEIRPWVRAPSVAVHDGRAVPRLRKGHRAWSDLRLTALLW